MINSEMSYIQVSVFCVVSAKECGLDEPCVEVANLISHSTQERLRDLIEKLAVVAGHRMDLKPKVHQLYNQTSDVKGQLRFLESLDEIEKNKAEEREKELLIKLSKVSLILIMRNN